MAAADRRARIVAAATSHVGCSDVLNVDLYNEVIVRPVDNKPALLGYYDRNKGLSTCALFAIGVLRLAGCTEVECCGTYFPGGSMRNAMADVQTLARRFGAWVSGSSGPVAAPKAGDIWIIADDHSMDAHTGVCLTDAALGSGSDLAMSAGTWMVDTAEGGQLASDGGSSAIQRFTREWHMAGNRWMLGQRYLLGYATAALMPVTDTPIGDDSPLAANPIQTDTKDA